MNLARGLRACVTALGLGLGLGLGVAAAPSLGASEPEWEPLSLRLSAELRERAPVSDAERSQAAAQWQRMQQPPIHPLRDAQLAVGPQEHAPSPARSQAAVWILGFIALAVACCAAIVLGRKFRHAGRSGSAAPARARLPAQVPGPEAAGEDAAQQVLALDALLQRVAYLRAAGWQDRAVKALREYISADRRASAAAWLQLLDLHHALGQREQYEAAASTFAADLGSRPPDFDAWCDDHVGLESWDHAMKRIADGWPSRDGLELIEALILQPPPAPDAAAALHPQVYRDLLLLHRVASEILRSQEADKPPADAQPAPGIWLSGPAGWLHWVLPVQLLLFAISVLLSGRDLNEHFSELEAAVSGVVDTATHPVQTWLQRGVSLLLLFASLERLYAHVRHPLPVPSPMLLVAFVLYWAATVAATGMFAQHPRLSHEYVYALVLGVAMALSGPTQRDHILSTFRNALVVFLTASFALLPAAPNLVMDWSYSQGLLPGVPRFGGLASHPVGMGVLAWAALMSLAVMPYRERRLQYAASAMAVTALILSQSKMAWVAFVLGAACIGLIHHPRPGLDACIERQRRVVAAAACTAFISVVCAGLYALLVADLPTAVAAYLDTPVGAQILSLTGRDKIWLVAWREWQQHPLFGYGMAIWGDAHRQEIGMPFATHGHNQLFDTLARSGTVGAVGLVAYALVITVQAFRCARATAGFSLALWIGLALLSVTEVPLVLHNFDSESFIHLLLVLSIAAGSAAARQEDEAAATRTPPRRMKGGRRPERAAAQAQPAGT